MIFQLNYIVFRHKISASCNTQFQTNFLLKLFVSFSYLSVILYLFRIPHKKPGMEAPIPGQQQTRLECFILPDMSALCIKFLGAWTGSCSASWQLSDTETRLFFDGADQVELVFQGRIFGFFQESLAHFGRDKLSGDFRHPLQRHIRQRDCQHVGLS